MDGLDSDVLWVIRVNVSSVQKLTGRNELSEVKPCRSVSHDVGSGEVDSGRTVNAGVCGAKDGSDNLVVNSPSHGPRRSLSILALGVDENANLIFLVHEISPLIVNQSHHAAAVVRVNERRIRGTRKLLHGSRLAQ